MSYICSIHVIHLKHHTCITGVAQLPCIKRMTGISYYTISNDILFNEYCVKANEIIFLQTT